MDYESGYEAGSEASPASSGSEISLAERKKPCEICGSDANEDEMMTCFMCKDTREHIYCSRVKKGRVPLMWICDECFSSDRVVAMNPRRNQVVHNQDPIDQTATSISMTTFQGVDNEAVDYNMTTSDSGNQIPATHQTSQPHASPVVEEASTPVPMDTSPVKLPDSTLPYDSESAI